MTPYQEATVDLKKRTFEEDYGVQYDSESAGAPQAIPPGHKMQRNRNTGETRFVPISGGGGVGVAKPAGAADTQTDLQKIEAFQSQLGAYLDSHPVEQAAQPPPSRTGVKEPTANVSTGVGRTITWEDMTNKAKSLLDQLHQSGQTGIHRNN
jgi:hypothetical protein